MAKLKSTPSEDESIDARPHYYSVRIPPCPRLVLEAVNETVAIEIYKLRFQLRHVQAKPEVMAM